MAGWGKRGVRLAFTITSCGLTGCPAAWQWRRSLPAPQSPAPGPPASINSQRPSGPLTLRAKTLPCKSPQSPSGVGFLSQLLPIDEETETQGDFQVCPRPHAGYTAGLSSSCDATMPPRESRDQGPPWEGDVDCLGLSASSRPRTGVTLHVSCFGLQPPKGPKWPLPEVFPRCQDRNPATLQD